MPKRYTYRDGKRVPAYRDKQTAKAIRRAGQKLTGEYRINGARAKYGATGRPAPVVVKTLDGMVLKTVDQSRLTQTVQERRRLFASRGK